MIHCTKDIIIVEFDLCSARLKHNIKFIQTNYEYYYRFQSSTPQLKSRRKLQQSSKDKTSRWTDYEEKKQT